MGFIDSHPKVRFAAIQVLGQLSDDARPEKYIAIEEIKAGAFNYRYMAIF